MEDIVVTWKWDDGESEVVEIICLQYNSVQELREKFSDVQKEWLPLLEENKKWEAEVAHFSIKAQLSIPQTDKITEWYKRRPKTYEDEKAFLKVGQRTFRMFDFIDGAGKPFLPGIMTLQEWFEKKLNERLPWEK